MSAISNKTLLGTYVGIPVNSGLSDAVTQQYDSFLNAMGQPAGAMDTFVDASLPESQWVSVAQWASDAWAGTSWTTGMIPVIGLPMASQGENADQSFRNIISGSEDAIFNGIFQAWASSGNSQFYIRPGFEMNGSWMPWAVTQANSADFVSAFQHIASLAHSFTGANIQVVWNPNAGSTLVPLVNLYPGNAAVDIVGLDAYGAPVDSGDPPGNTSTDPNTVTVLDMLALAKANGKQFALPEAGGTDAPFATALGNTIAQSGVSVAFMNIWDINDYSGNLSWSNPSDNQAATATAWKQAFQTIASANPSGPTPTPAPTPTPTPTPTVTVSPNNTVVTGTTAAITDASGNKWTITNAGQVAINGATDIYTGNVTELAYVNGMIWHENSSKMWWGETQPNDSWAPSAGTTTSPLPATPTPIPTPTVTVSPNNTVVTGTTAAITDASGNKWTITNAGQVAINGATDIYTGNVTELAYVNGMIWHENSSKMWWGETQPNDSWAPSAGTTTSPLPATPTPTVTVSPNNTMVLAGSKAGITDVSGSVWTISNGGQVAVNGVADPITANVVELAYVNNKVWQENTSNLWWGKTSTTAAWAPNAGTSTSPLPAPTVIAANATSATVSQSQVSVIATAGNHMLFISGSGNIVNLSGGANTITDTGTRNTYILPAAGKGTDTFTNNILTTGDTLDLKAALAATNWNGAASTLSKYLTVADTAKGAVLSIAPTSGGVGVAIATINGATTANLTGLLAHSFT